MNRIPITIIVASLGACGAERALYSDPGAQGNVQAVVDAQRPGGDGSPDASALTCPPLPADRPLMPNLSVGWAAEGSGTTRLQFGSHAFGCGTDIAAEYTGVDACPNLWAFELAVAPEALAPGDLVLTPAQEGTIVQFERSRHGPGCARDTIRSSSRGFTGRLRIHAVDEECIVGEFIDLGFPTDDLADISGVFVAERC